MDTDFSSGLYKICVWIMRLACLNLLWVLFSIAGLIFLGFFPATTAMFTIERKWINGEEDIQLFSLFWCEFKKAFFKSNVLGYFMTFFGLLLFMNYRLITVMEGLIVNFLSILVLGLAFVYVIVWIYIFPVYCYYDVKLIDYVKHALAIGILSPLMTLLIVISIFLFSYFSTMFPGIILFYSGSCLSFVTMWFAHCAFGRVEQKHLRHRNA